MFDNLHRDIGNDFVSQIAVADGVGNRFIFTNAKDGKIHFDYFGLKPIESRLWPSDSTIQSRKNRDKWWYVGERMMGTTSVRATNNGITESYNLSSSGDFTKKLHQFLNSFKN